jgi:outer membrane protein assembly factor BamB
MFYVRPWEAVNVRVRGYLPLAVIVLAVLLASIADNPPRATTDAAAKFGDWPSYMIDAGHTGSQVAETAINAVSAPSLRGHWTIGSGGSIFSQPVVVGGTVYWGAWDGNERAADLNGKVLWSHSLGTTSNPLCGSFSVGIASTAAYSSIGVGYKATPVIIVGGGDAALYALNASTGAVVWRTQLGVKNDAFIWDSPVVDSGHVFIGVSSFFDCPLVQGTLVELDAATGAVQRKFTTVPNSCIGGGVWGSPVIDSAAGTVYIASGNPSTHPVCRLPTPYAEALVELRESDLSVVGSWPVPASQRTGDSDFGSTPNLFTAGTKQMVGVPNKNGYYYAFQRDHVGSGPVWFDRIADGTAADVVPAAVGTGALIIAGPHTTINGVACTGSVRSVNPATGAYNWQQCLKGKIWGAVSLTPTVAVVAAGSSLVVVAISNGTILFTSGTATKSLWRSSASISNGVIYIGNINGNLYAYGL